MWVFFICLDCQGVKEGRRRGYLEEAMADVTCSEWGRQPGPATNGRI